MNRIILLLEVSWVKAKEYIKEEEVALLPVGPIEQHDPHNPLETDHLIAYKIAIHISARTGTLCLPPHTFRSKLSSPTLLRNNFM